MKLLRKFQDGPGAPAQTDPTWRCGHSDHGRPCPIGPGKYGRCRGRYECTPAKGPDGAWRCRRTESLGGRCKQGPAPDGTCCTAIPRCKPIRTLRAKRETISRWTAAFVGALLVLALAYSANLELLVPGPVTTAHGGVDKCSDCHANIAEGPFGWLHAAFAEANPREDTKACLVCHKQTNTALNPHGIEVERLRAYTKSVEANAAAKAQRTPASIRAREVILPVRDTFPKGIHCATCHQEHQGLGHDLAKVSNERCHSCHVVQFENFAADHPDFASYPFRRRTRINFDHTSHFGKHFPEVSKKKTAGRTVPGACADCHTTDADRGHMGVKPFEKICSSCHLDQIVGAERATGPKGIALLTLPGLDVETLQEKKQKIGEWPAESEGEITPLMKLLIGWDPERRKLLKDVSDLDLLDLTEATDEQIRKVGKLAWEVKHLMYALITSRTSAIFKRLGSGTKMPINGKLVSDLTGNIPRDVLMSAQREWLPNLFSEVDESQFNAWIKSSSVEPSLTAPAPGSPPATKALVFGPLRDAVPAGAGRLVQLAQEKKKGFWRVDPFGRLLKDDKPSEPGDTPEQSESADTQADSAPSEPDTENANATPADAGQPDPEPKPEADPEPKKAEQAPPAPAADLALDAESWTESGGWYRQEYAILYKPTGHEDRFVRAWLDLTATLYQKKPEENLAAIAFQHLTSKDAQGQCMKCHSADATPAQSRLVNWGTSSRANRDSLFTRFDHVPHFGIVGAKGCLTCHERSTEKGYQETYKGYDPRKFVSNFKAINQDSCAACHSGEEGRNDCLLCHKYHVFGVTTPITETKVPTK